MNQVWGLGPRAAEEGSLLRGVPSEKLLATREVFMREDVPGCELGGEIGHCLALHVPYTGKQERYD